MPRPPKVICNKAVLLVTTSLEEGLLFPPNPLINLILGSCLARAQTLHPVKVCHHLFEPNHGHLILAVENPDDVPDFMERFKTESANAINRLLGRRKRTVWCEGYDSPPILTISSVISKIVYIYTNPSKDGLENTIHQYPGLSSWEAFNKPLKTTETYPRVRRFHVPCITKDENISTLKLANKLIKKIKTRHKFTVNPDAWMDAFQIYEDSERQAINAEIKEKVIKEEQSHRETRKQNRTSVIGRQKLISSPMNLDYVSLKKGKRMICISDDKELRKNTINDIRARQEEGREVIERWKLGDFRLQYPIGLFPPSFPKRCEAYSSSGFALGED